MRRFLSLACLLILTAACARPAMIPKDLRLGGELDAIFRSAAAYRFGESRETLSEIESRVAASQSSTADRASMRRGLAWLAASPESSFDAKLFACRQLAVIGTPDEVPAVAVLLTEDKTADAARIALENIPGREATGALIRAIPPSSGDKLVGIINSLGIRRDPAAIEPIVLTMGDADLELFTAGTEALANIGNRKAARILSNIRNAQTGEKREAATDALLRCADGLLAERDSRTATEIYKRCLSPEDPVNIRSAALRGFVQSAPEDAVAAIASALQDENPKLRRQAAQLVRVPAGSEATLAFTALLPKLDTLTQVQVLNALGDRKDPAASPSVVALLESDDEEVRIAALQTLGRLGDPTTVGVLATHAAGDNDATARAARTALATITTDRAGAIESEMVQLLQSSTEAEAQAAIARALADRKATFTVPALLKGIHQDKAAVRRACFLALADLADERHIEELARAASTEIDSDARDEAAQAVVAVARRAEQPEAQSAKVLKLLQTTGNPRERAALLGIAGKIGGPDSLRTLLASLEDSNVEIRRAAVSALGQWESDAPADRLLIEAQGDAAPEIRRLAWEGYARLIALPSDRSEAETLKRYQDALAKTNSDEKTGVIAGLGRFKTIESLRLVAPYLDDKLQRRAASEAAVEIAQAVSGAYPSETKAMMQKIAASADGATKQRAESIIRAVERFEDFITAWEVAGPFSAPDKNGSDLFDMEFAPENGGAAGADWQRMPAATDGARPWLIDFNRSFAGNNRAAYLRTRIWSPIAQDARLEVGSDDGVKVWLNGELVHANNASRPVSPGDDKVTVKLREGWNPMLMKVTNGGGDWGACARLRTTDGQRLDGLRFETGPVQTAGR